MEEDKAHQLYTHLQRFDASARHKKGLGFATEKSNRGDVWEKSNFIAFRKESEAAAPSAEKGSSMSARRHRSGSPRRRESSRDSSRGGSRNYRRRHQSRDRSRRRRGGRKEKRSRSDSVSSKSLSQERRRRKHRRDRDRSRRCGSPRRSKRDRSRSLDRIKRIDRRCDDRSNRQRFVQSGGLSVDWSGQPKRETTDYGKRIPGYDAMTSVDQLKAKARYLEERYGATHQESLSIHHSSLQKDKPDMHTDEMAKELPTVLHTGVLDATRRLEKAHEDAIFGNHTSKPDSCSHPGSTVGVAISTAIPEHTADGNDPPRKEGPLVSSQVILSQKTTSWRERAAWIRQRREGGLN